MKKGKGMSSRELKNKPLVEAIFEIRWALQHKVPGIATDPHYRLLLGRLYDRFQSAYPEHEQLDTANLPDEMSGHIVQHRFRTSAAQWPLVQLGPGVLTVNDTAKYRWDDFRVRVIDAQTKLYEAHPRASELRPSHLVLRYIDAVEFDFHRLDCLDFLRDQLKVSVTLPKSLFDGTQVTGLPQHFVSQVLFRSESPRGVIHLKLATGQRDDKPALIWETTVESAGTDLPTMPDEFPNWLDASHRLVNDWFFKMIEGDLRRRFSGE